VTNIDANIGYVDVADPRLGPELLSNIVDRGKRLLSSIKSVGISTISVDRVITTEREIGVLLEEFSRNNCCGIIIRTAWFLRSNAIVGIAQRSHLPCLIWATPNQNDPGFEGLALSHGALDEVGIAHKIHYGDTSESSIKKIINWAKACGLKQKLMNAVYGEIGGRCLEMIPGSSDFNQLRKIFGLHVDNIEQWSLIHKSEEIPDSQWRPVADRWKEAFGDFRASKDSLEKSAKLYLAGHQMFQERNWDFAGIQCQLEMIDNYLAPCLPVAMWNEDGFTVSCETDINNALGMFVAHYFTGKSAMFADIFHYNVEQNIIHALNCGTAAPSNAGDMKDIQIIEQSPLQGSWDDVRKCSLCKGGCCTHFVMPPGPVTFIRFGRIDGRYVIHLEKGKAIEHKHDDGILEGLGGVWPFAYIRLDDDVNPESFIENMRSHHAVIARSECVDAVAEFARLTNIPVL